MPAGVRRRVLVAVVMCAGALTFVGAALAGNGGFLPVAPHSPNAHRIKDAYVFILVFTGVIFVGVEGALLAFVIRYRRGKRPRTLEGPQIHGREGSRCSGRSCPS
jgi:heme/copper-type cytochrome/quinol oxidase subunit 2